MGIESYLLRLRSPHQNAAEIASYSQRTLGITPDPVATRLTSAYSYYVFRDETHVIEFELFEDDSSCDVSLRFALCHPPSVDEVFLSLAVDLITRFNLTATICEELPDGEPRGYAVSELDRFTANCFWSIARSRGSWQQMFGTDVSGLSCLNALRRYCYGEAV